MLRMLTRVSTLCVLSTMACAADDTADDATDDGGSDTDTDTDTDTDEDLGPDPTAGCGSSAEPGDSTQTLMVGDLERTYVLVIPAGYDPDRAYPLIFAFHGYGSSPSLSRNYFKLEEQTGEDAVVVYPAGIIRTGAPGWSSEGPEDFDFFDAVLAELSSTLCLDANRIFVTGHSNGGSMTNALGCQRSEVIRAIAPVAGGGPSEELDCGGPVPAMVIHGELDDTVPVTAGEQSRDYWHEAASCDDQTQGWGGFDECIAYDGCERPVVWCLHQEEEFGGHWWPTFGGAAVWDFFSQFN